MPYFIGAVFKSMGSLKRNQAFRPQTDGRLLGVIRHEKNNIH